MSTLDEITKEKQRVSEALARVDAQREKLIGQLSELEATERVLTRYSKGTQAKKTASAKTPTPATKAAAPARSRGRPRTTTPKAAVGKRGLAEPGRSGPCPSNRKDAAGNHRCVRGGSPEPRRIRHIPAQAGWPHRTARREALRHAINGDGARHRSLTPG